GLAVRGDEHVVHPPAEIRVARAGWEERVEVSHRRDDVRLVQGTGTGEQISQVRGGARAEAGEALRGLGRGPAAARGHPARRREMVEGDDRREAVLTAGGAYPPVVLERRPRPLALLRLDAA